MLYTASSRPASVVYSKERYNLLITMTRPEAHVGIVGAGIGGLAAGIAIARAGATVTILEATTELGEIGAGIQVWLFPLVATIRF